MRKYFSFRFLPPNSNKLAANKFAEEGKFPFLRYGGSWGWRKSICNFLNKFRTS
jgi:hypothetical protein